MTVTDHLLSLPYSIWILTALVGLLALYLFQHLYVIWTLPPGPFPLPVLGNLLAFRGKNNEPHFLVPKWRKKYGDVFTIWLGPRPTIMVCSWDYFKECLSVKRNDFAGRIKRDSVKIVFNQAEDVAFGDLGPCWETLKKTMTSAVRKFSVSQELADVIAEVVDEVIDLMLKEGKPVDGRSYAFITVFNVLASSTFGKRFSFHDEDFISMKSAHEEMVLLFGQGFPSDVLPFLHVFYKQRENQFKEAVTKYNYFFWAYYEDHKKSYQTGSRQAIQSDRDNCPYTSAVIMEVLRKHSPFVLTLEHRTTCNTEIGKYKIPKDTLVMFHMTSIHHDENYWKDPEAMKPERFLEPDGKLSSTRMEGYAPFSAGRRGCPGEKLATADLFLMITRILQQLDLDLDGGPGSASFDLDVFAIFGRPKHYNMVVKKRRPRNNIASVVLKAEFCWSKRFRACK